MHYRVIIRLVRINEEVEVGLSPYLSLNENIELLLKEHYHLNCPYTLALKDGTVLNGELSFEECGLIEGETLICRY